MNVIGQGSKLWAAFRVWSEFDFEYHDFVAPLFESDYGGIADNYMRDISSAFHRPPMIILERIWRT